MTKTSRESIHYIKIIVLVLVAALSITFVTRVTSSPEYHEKRITELDKKKVLVMELSAAAAATSAAITLLPDDAGTPVAEKLADLSSYFLLITCAIYLEKYLLTISGYIAFTWFIPIGCLLIGYALFRKNPSLKKLGIKLITFGLTMYLTVPISLAISGRIENTYSTSIQQTIDTARETVEEIEDGAVDGQDGLGAFVSRIWDGVSGMATKIRNTLNNFIEAIAVLIVTSCIFPILTFMCCMWVVQLIWGVDLGMPNKGPWSHVGHGKNSGM